MTLRTRILLGYGYLIGLLLLSVSVAAVNSQRVAGNSKQVLERNIRNLTHAITMIEKLERQDSETLLALLQPTTGTSLDDAERAFDAALTSADDLSKTNVDDEDRPTLAAVRTNFEEYRKARAELLSRVYDDPLTAAEDYRGATQKALLLLKAELDDYVTRKTESLKQANDEASRSALEGAVLLGVMVTVALLSLGFLSRSLQRDVLGRLTEVGHVTEAIAAGDRRRRVRDFYQDELGLVARQLNAALDRQQELESQMQGRLLEQRRVLVGLMFQWPTPAGMIGIDGEIVASTLNVEDEAELHRLTPRVRAAAGVLMKRRFVKADELSVDIKANDGRRLVQIRALASGDNQIAGWLASFVDPGLPDASGIHPIPREPSAIMPVASIAHEVSGVLPIAPAPHEASGVLPGAHETSDVHMAQRTREPSGLMAVAHGLASGSPEASGVRPIARASSGALSMARSGPLRAASREGHEDRDAEASEAALAVNVAMLTDPEMTLPDLDDAPMTVAEGVAATDTPEPPEPDETDDSLAGTKPAPAAIAGSDALGVPAVPDAPSILAPDATPVRPATIPPRLNVPSISPPPASTASPTPSSTFAPPALPRLPVIARAPAIADKPPRDPDEST